MARRELIAVAFACVLASGSIITLLYPAAYPSALGYESAEAIYRESQETRENCRPHTVKIDPERRPVAPKDSIRCYAHSDEAEKREYNRSDLIEQRRAADAAQQSVVIGQYQAFVSLVALLISFWTLCAAVIAARYAKQAADAAFKAIDADLLSTRPVVQLAVFSIRPEVTGDEFASGINLDVMLKNYGQSGCWLEQVTLWVTGNPKVHEPDIIADGAFHGFIGPGDQVSAFGDFHTFSLTPVEEDRIQNELEVFVGGGATYRDAGGRRWTTHFAYSIELDAAYCGNKLVPLSDPKFWNDHRLDDMTGKPEK